ncbi:ATP-binding cassette domain-containing protein [bacterium]|nr:ATP-binding cassette domain-containing protein [bacterium]
MTNNTHKIRILGAREHNLKNISLEIPHHKLVAVTGISGSGKSSLAFDTIAAEGRRQYLESIPSFARQFAGRLSKPDVSAISNLYPVIAISQRITNPSSRSTVGTLSEIYDYLRLLYARFGETTRKIELSRSLFSFNSPLGACPHCNGLGLEEKISIEKLVADPHKSIREGALAPTLPNGYIMYSQVTVDVLNTVCNQHGFSVDIRWKDLSPEHKNIILHGSKKIKVLYGKHSLESRLKWTGLKAKPREEGYYKGMLPVMQDILRRDRNKNILRYVESIPCSVCKGMRLNENALSVRYAGYSIHELVSFELIDLLDIVDHFEKNSTAEEKIINTLHHQLTLLCNLGAGYLQLSRKTATLTTGEIQRIRLVNQLSANLSNVLYVFDEPSIGLHPRDNHQMIAILRELVIKGNTVIIIEHDLETIRQAMWIVEIGPGAGNGGGELLYNGPAAPFIRNQSPEKQTPTQKALNSTFLQHEYTNKGDDFLLKNCTVHNLKGFDVIFKKDSLNVITGVSGAGKASLIYGCLLPRLDDVIKVDQTPIGRTPRSNPATYTGLSNLIRDIYARQDTARQLGYTRSRFSFNNKGGRCEICQGGGKIQIGMHFMGSVDLICEACNGKRFNEETLQVKYNGKSISDVYNLSIDQAASFFQDESKVLKYLSVLRSLDLGYLKLGQPSTTLSGGEAQRIKLATALVKRRQAHTWYILDEPSSGLHYQDTQYLINALRGLAEQGNTIVYIEHQEQLIKAADWIIDLGPGSGSNGGQLVFQGRWEGFEKCSHSITSGSLRHIVRKKSDETSTRCSDIWIHNAKTNNLKGIDVRFPKNKITVITGLSGSGKSSLAFDTLFAESQSRFMESLSTYSRSFIRQANIAIADSFENLTPVVAINRKNLPISPRSTIGTMTGIHEKYRYLFSRVSGINGRSLFAKSFSFNHESGACRSCSGLGYRLTTDPLMLVPDMDLSIEDGALAYNSYIKYYGHPHSQFVAILKKVSSHFEIDLKKSFNEFSKEELDLILYGTGDRIWNTVWEYKTKTATGSKEISSTWKGFCNLIDEEYQRRLHNKKLDVIVSMMHEVMCNNCSGARLHSEALSVFIDGMNIHDLCKLSIVETMHWFELQLQKTNKIKGVLEIIYSHIKPLLTNLIELGLGHLSMHRRSSTLSGGEGQRLRLARQLGGGLTGMTYILDEPTIGLHPKDVHQLLNVIRRLQEKGNTIIIVEHDREVMNRADNLIEMGPGSGENGGHIVANGSYDRFIMSKSAITPRYLDGHNMPVPQNRNMIKNAFGLKGVNKHNLFNRDFQFSAGGLVALTGVSGAGKSTLIHHVLFPSWQNQKPMNCNSYYFNTYFDQLIAVDQRALPGRRISTIASYTGLLNYLQLFYSNTKVAKKVGIKKNAFSYQHSQGKCIVCNGYGQIKITMDFMDDVWNECDNCHGTRYNEIVSSIYVEGVNMPVLLSYSIAEAIVFFNAITDHNIEKIFSVLSSLQEMGLGHLKLNQTTSSLSCGEAQRIKLAIHLLKTRAKKVLYLLDEPTSGLHYRDIDTLIDVFNRIVDDGHTVLCIEHNDYLISAANQVVEM